VIEKPVTSARPARTAAP